MVILADENIDHRIIEAIELIGIRVYSIYFTERGLSDTQIAEISKFPPRIILTEDKDLENLFLGKAMQDYRLYF